MPPLRLVRHQTSTSRCKIHRKIRQINSPWPSAEFQGQKIPKTAGLGPQRPIRLFFGASLITKGNPHELGRSTLISLISVERVFRVGALPKARLRKGHFSDLLGGRGFDFLRCACSRGTPASLELLNGVNSPTFTDTPHNWEFFYLRLGLFYSRLVFVAYSNLFRSFLLRLKFGLVSFAYGGKSVWSLLLTVPPRPEIGFGLFYLRFPHCK